MKNHILKWATVFLSVLCLTALLTIGTSAAESKIENDDGLRVGYGNLVFKDTIYLRYAVSTETYGADDMVLLVWTEPQTSSDEYLYGTQSLILSPAGTVGISGVTHAVFDYKGLTAKQMTDYIYARACILSDDATEVKYGAVVKYSVLQYSYSLLGKTGTSGTTNEKLIKLLNAMLNYGAAAQEYTEYKTDWLANDAFYELKVEGGILPDGTTTGLYKKDSKVVITANAPAEGYQFAGWKNAAGEIVSTDVAYEVTVGEANETYTATYEEAVKYSQGLKFTPNGDGTCYVTIGSCTDTDLVIPPESPEGWKVTGIGDSAFYDQIQVISIVIPDSVTSIGQYAFSGCTELANIEIPNGVTSIGFGAFGRCSSLESITLPFVGCSQKIANDTYQYPFGYIFGTSSYTGGVSTLQPTFLVNTNSPSYSQVYFIPQKLKTVIITGGNIMYGAFYHCAGLTSIEIPAGVTSIGEDAFFGCTSLTNVTFEENSQLISIGQRAFFGCSGMTDIEIPDSVTSIGENAFTDCTSLTSITIPDSVTSIGKSAFADCTSLTSITIPDSVTSIDERAFFGCTSLTSITIPDSVTFIGSDTFSCCTGLTSIVMPNSVISIDAWAFYRCSGLTDIYYTGTTEEWASMTISTEGNSNLLNATIHHNYSPTAESIE